MKNIDWEKLNYRRSTVAVVLNKNNKMLIIQKQSYKENEWDGPGGGIEEDESPEEAIVRELKEELGTDKFEIVKCSQMTDKYNWPREYVLKRFLERGKTYLGQERKQFLVKFWGEDNEIKIPEKEIRKFEWAEIKELEKYFIFPNQYQKTQKLFEEWRIDSW
ncbi:hypothetical protein COS78_04185 [Candidatus Shapirobacteria bacterium CG06_land_8_20_14_3_00_40_12]|uniref:Nudix hydrolase domain-containing protein n=2 Tax=Candidatus Shapironibacteriota TaxID=1752721 RepID=A0A2M7TU35_9BACT|nr:MAG: hypothetical protein COS78_04185 [Candidatus Shapirobacteria bacterium CG06_land_8_20_14_3_00_40_12]PIZ61339.1 MAG: hypothetical protein COY20_00500 [Candidatus Shapirobacteria bacterium CG_4_10_14_0_2_um_filter_40_12]